MKKLLPILLGSILYVSFGFAQEGVEKTSYNKNNVVSFRVYDTKVKKIDESKSKETIKDLVKAKKEDELIERKTLKDEFGYIHHFY
jgi:hypothetical protein